MKQILFLTAIFLFSAATWAQPVQTIRGRVTDKESKTPLPGANVVLVGSNPLIGASTDADGNFSLEKVPLGRAKPSVPRLQRGISCLAFAMLFEGGQPNSRATSFLNHTILYLQIGILDNHFLSIEKKIKFEFSIQAK